MKATAFKALCALVVASLSNAALGDTISLLQSGQHSFSADTTNTAFTLTAQQPAGSGVFNPFVRIQRSDVEQGYNSNDTANTLDDHPNGPANPVIPMNTILTANNHIILTLDYNETGSKAEDTIILNDLQLVVSTNDNRSGPSSFINGNWVAQPIVPDPAAQEVQLYHMDQTTRTDAGFIGDNFTILMNAKDRPGNGNGGSGAADLIVDIDLSGVNLAGLVDGNHFLYVYSAFTNTFAGYEEWSIDTHDPVNPPNVGATPTPLPASVWAGMALMGALLAGKKILRHKRAVA